MTTSDSPAPESCSSCGAELPRDAAFCPGCGAAAAGTRGHEEVCEIVWWRGYVKSAFVAVTRGPDAATAEPLTSPFFRSKGKDPPVRGGAAADAHAALLQQLLGEGWEPSTQGRLWFSQRFVRVHVGAQAPVPALRRDSEPLPFPKPGNAGGPAGFDTVTGHAADAPAAESLREDPVERERVITDPAPEPVHAPARQPRWKMRVGVVLFAGVIGTLVAEVSPSLFKAGSANGDALARKQSVASPPASRPRPEPNGAAQRLGAPPETPRRARVVISATRGDSWIEARAGSQTGRILYNETLTQGRTVTISARRVWLSLAAAGNLDVLVNGKAPQAPLLGTIEAVFGPGSSG